MHPRPCEEEPGNLGESFSGASVISDNNYYQGGLRLTPQHFVCRRCGHVWDVYLSSLDVWINRRRTGLDGFQVDRRDVQLHGLCADCR